MIIRDKHGNIVTETTNKTLLQMAQDAAGIPEAEQVGTDKVNCIKRKIDELNAKAKQNAEELVEQTSGEVDGEV